MRIWTLTAVFFLVFFFSTSASASAIRVDWPGDTARHWVGPDLWANRLQDWKTRSGRLECIEFRAGKPFRTVHLLSHRLENYSHKFKFQVDLGVTRPIRRGSIDSVAGFLIGAGGPDLDYRSAALIHHGTGKGAGFLAGIGPNGTLRFSYLEKEGFQESGKEAVVILPDTTRLVIEGSPSGSNEVQLFLRAFNPHDPSQELDSLSITIPGQWLLGGLGLVSHPGQGENTLAYWFKNWEIDGPGIIEKPENKLGPILGTQYTLSRNVLKLTAQLMPVGDSDSQQVHLQLLQSGHWKTVASTDLIIPGWTATFRIEDWNDTMNQEYRVVYDALCDGGVQRFTWKGEVARNPEEKSEIVLAGFTGNHNTRGAVDRKNYHWTADSIWFPHHDIVERVSMHKPDLLFFSGDQVYEGASPTTADRSGEESSYFDYLYKWYLWSWAYRDLTSHIPCVTIPDDHDVFQGNVWGQSGRFALRDHDGGYIMPADWVNMIQRTQTSHLPDPFDPRTVDRGITVYYTDLVWGRIGFAILEDRKFKTGPNGLVPETGSGRPDHVIDPDFDPKTADVEGAVLLGERQHHFLEHFVQDWKGTDMKVALSQTIFAGLATHHGAGLNYLVADYDSNAWPQSGRNKALDLLRRGSVFMVGGDQHLATVAQHGIDDWDDAGWSFCVPSIANFYPRSWNPPYERDDSVPWPESMPDYTGRFLDGLGNHVTVYAATNPGVSTGHKPEALHDRMPGYGIVKLNKRDRNILMECWPRYADPSSPGAKPYEGWPILISMYDNDGRTPVAYLPEIHVIGIENPVIEVRDSLNQNLIYSVRLAQSTYKPPVFAPGSYSIRVGEPDRDLWKSVDNLSITENSDAKIILGF